MLELVAGLQSSIGWGSLGETRVLKGGGDVPMRQVEAVRLEEQVKKQFEKLHEFLRDEEQALLSELQEEMRRKHDLLEGKMKQLSEDCRTLLREARQLQTDLKEDDYTFLMVKSCWGALQGVALTMAPSYPCRGASGALGDPLGFCKPP